MNWKHPLFYASAILLAIEIVVVALMPEIPKLKFLDPSEHPELYNEVFMKLIVLTSASFIAGATMFISGIILILKGRLKQHFVSLGLLVVGFILPIVYYYSLH